MKVALISYHKNARLLYDGWWIQAYKDSIVNQTYKQFDIFELEYGGGDFRIFGESNYHSKEFPTFVHALNYLLDCVFFMGYDCVFNTNADDYYSLNRVEKQLPYIELGYDIVSSNFSLVEGGNITHRHSFENKNIEIELAENNNIVAHPCVCYSKYFWEKHRYVPDEIPFEDLKLWQRAIVNSKFKILPDMLLYHRLHNQSVCQSQNR